MTYSEDMRQSYGDARGSNRKVRICYSHGRAERNENEALLGLFPLTIDCWPHDCLCHFLATWYPEVPNPFCVYRSRSTAPSSPMREIHHLSHVQGDQPSILSLWFSAHSSRRTAGDSVAGDKSWAESRKTRALKLHEKPNARSIIRENSSIFHNLKNTRRSTG